MNSTQLYFLVCLIHLPVSTWISSSFFVTIVAWATTRRSDPLRSSTKSWHTTKRIFLWKSKGDPLWSSQYDFDFAKGIKNLSNTTPDVSHSNFKYLDHCHSLESARTLTSFKNVGKVDWVGFCGVKCCHSWQKHCKGGENEGRTWDYWYL